MFYLPGKYFFFHILGLAVQIGILKLTNITIPYTMSDTKTNHSYQLGSRITSVTIIDDSGQSVPYIHDYPFNVTYPLLLVSSCFA